jgi:hypothetical protein
MTTLSYDEIHDELYRVEEAFIRILGKKPLYVSPLSLTLPFSSSTISNDEAKANFLQFRPPYGSYNDLVLQVLGERGYKKVFLWSDDTQDASGASVGAQQGVMDQVIGSYPQPKMVLQHSVLADSESTRPFGRQVEWIPVPFSSPSSRSSSSSCRLKVLYRILMLTAISASGVLNYAVGQLQGRGYQLVAVDTCLGDQGEYPYQYVGEPGQRDGSWVC